MDAFKDAIFCYEVAALPAELKVVDGIRACFQEQPEAATTFVQAAHSLDDAAKLIDQFKAKTCGSAYSLALININMLGELAELKFLLQAEVLGDPRTIFIASLRYMVGANYAFAKQKIQTESECRERTPSCLDCYSAANREATAERISVLMAAYLREAEERAKSRRNGLPTVGCSMAGELLKKSITTFYGKGLKVKPPQTGA